MDKRNNFMTKIIPKQPQTLIVNGKIISVESGAIVNSYDLNDKEFIDTIKYIDINRYHVMIEAARIENELNKDKL